MNFILQSVQADPSFASDCTGARGEGSGVLRSEGSVVVGGRKGVCKTRGTTKHKEREQGRNEVNRKHSKAHGKDHMRDREVEEQAGGKGMPRNSFVMGQKHRVVFPQRFTNLLIKDFPSHGMRCIL